MSNMIEYPEYHKNNIERFSDRFGIQVDIKACQVNFINRVLNGLEEHFKFLFVEGDLRNSKENRTLKHIASRLGQRYIHYGTIFTYLNINGQQDFINLLQILEALYEHPGNNTLIAGRSALTSIVSSSLSMNEIELGIRWDNGIFHRVGAGILDDELVRKSLDWLADPKYKNILRPFHKGLTHFLESDKNSERLSDTVTDMYEATEALAKIITNRDRDLSANKELFIKALQLNVRYEHLIKEYITYANEYRHAVGVGGNRELPNFYEVEAFVYLTGIFIRLAIQSSENQQ